MKFKLTWIPFIPLILIGCFCKLGQVFLPEGIVFGLTSMQLDYIFMGAVALIFIFALIFTLIDKRMAPYYQPVRNISAGILSILIAVTLAADGADTLIRVFGAGKIDILNVLCGLFALLSAVVFVVLGFNHFLNKSSKNIALLNVAPAVLCALRMILCFVQFTTISIRLADVSCLICYICATLFFFYYAIVRSLVKSKNALKYAIIFGFPAIAALFPYSLYHLMFYFDTQNILSNIQPFELFLFALYIFAVLFEMTCFMNDKDSLVIVDGESEEEDDASDSDVKAEDFIVSSDGNNHQDHHDAGSYLTTQDTSDFLYHEVHREESSNENESTPDVDDYLTEVSAEDSDDRPKNYEERLDEIDKLILEISEKAD